MELTTGHMCVTFKCHVAKIESPGTMYHCGAVPDSLHPLIKDKIS